MGVLNHASQWGAVAAYMLLYDLYSLIKTYLGACRTVTKQGIKKGY